MNYWSMPIRTVFEDLKTSHKGLSEEEAEKRLLIYGLNEIKKERKSSPIRILLRQFANALVLVLLAATAVSYFLGDMVDSFLIVAVVMVNAGFGFIQEYRAEQTIEALRKMTALKVTVLRSGEVREIEATKAVPGDVIELIEGEKVPADCRTIESVNLQADESTLTGESTPVDKKNVEVAENTRMADRINTLYNGTTIVRGHGKAVIYSTGMDTEVGKIAKEIQVPSPQTPLQIYLDKFGKKLGLAVLLICAIVFVFSSNIIKDPLELFMISVSLAVAAIPEGLPAIVTLSLAFGVRKMAGKNALVRKLSAVEALGSATVICTDKTGTLTENRMVVKKVYCDGKMFDAKDCKADMLFRIGLICNNSVLERIDPTEAALVDSARKSGIDTKEFFEYERITEIPFSSETKRMTVVCKKAEEEIVFMKGAPGAVLSKCNRLLEKGRVVKLTVKSKEEIEDAIDAMAEQALRVLGFAYKTDTDKSLEDDLIFVGVQGMIDPPRKEVKDAIAACKAAGINVIIITGDHPLTAKAIAEDIGLEVNNIITGDEVERLSFDELRAKVSNTTIFARVDPSHKNRIVKALKANGEIVAVTGDGVNDAPALRNAEIGVAMGIRGTDVAKEASDMVITDDNFTTIVLAIEEGRRIFDNIKKAIIYLLSSNLGEVLLVFIASLFFLPLPLTAVQLLWVNLLSDGFPALALGVDPPDPNIMRRKPSRTKGEVLSTNSLLAIIRTGVLIGVACLFLYMLYRPSFSDPAHLMRAQTVAFTALVAMEFVVLQTVRHQYGQHLFSNKYLSISLLLVAILQLAVLYTPLNSLFHVVPIKIIDWVAIFLAVSALFIFNHLVNRFVKSE